MSVEKKKWQFVLFQFFCYLCFTGISWNLVKTPILKDIFIFLANDNWFCVNCFVCVFHWYKRKSCRNANIEGYFHFSSKWSLFSKIIVSTGNSKFWKVSVFWWRYFPLVKNVILCKKSVSFWPNEWIFKYSDKIMSCKLWSKVTSVFLNINFCAKMSILGKKENWISWEMLIFSNNCALLLKVNILLENMLISRKLWLFVWLSI